MDQPVSRHMTVNTTDQRVSRHVTVYATDHPLPCHVTVNTTDQPLSCHVSMNTTDQRLSCHVSVNTIDQRLLCHVSVYATHQPLSCHVTVYATDRRRDVRLPLFLPARHYGYDDASDDEGKDDEGDEGEDGDALGRLGPGRVDLVVWDHRCDTECVQIASWNKRTRLTCKKTCITQHHIWSKTIRRLSSVASPFVSE